MGSGREVDKSNVGGEGIFVDETELRDFAKPCELPAHCVTRQGLVKVGDLQVGQLDCLLLEDSQRVVHSDTQLRAADRDTIDDQGSLSKLGRFEGDFGFGSREVYTVDGFWAD